MTDTDKEVKLDSCQFDEHGDTIANTAIEKIATLFCDNWIGRGSYDSCGEDRKEWMKNVARQAYIIARDELKV